MIYQNNSFENTENQFSKTIKELQIGKLLRKSNIRKSCGVPASEVFQFLLLLVFQGKNLFRFLNSKRKDQAVSKNTYYRFLDESSYNWRKFLLLLAAKVTSAFDSLTRPERVKTLILDDSVITRNRSKKVELLARVYDHVNHKFQKGFTLLTLGWSDGYSFIPVGFNMLSSANKSNRVFTKKENIPVKIVFVRNRNKKSECLYLLSTDCNLNETEIIRIYGNRWSIEVFFKASKSCFKLGTEFQSRSYDAIVSHTTIVFTRYTLLEWIRRHRNDQKTYGELFYMFCDDIQDMDLTSALKSLMALFMEQLNTFTADITEVIKCKLQDWMSTQALFIQAMFTNLSWES